MQEDAYYMRLALEEAQKAYDLEEVPIGAVLVDSEGEVVARGHNMREVWHDATAHAEMIAIREACAKEGRWRLSGLTLYVTIEPCPMCAGAIVNARIPRVVYGAGDAKSGAVRSVCGLFDMGFNHHPKVESGILEEACGALLTEFFQKLRVELRSRPRWKPQNQGTSS